MLPRLPMQYEEKLVDYEAGSKIGSGGQASVYKYFYPPANQFLAVKVLLWPGSDGDGWSKNAKQAEHSVREVRLLQALELCHYPDGVALIMPYYELGNLTDQKKGLNLAQKKEAIRQILDGLSHLHKKGIIHRDIKPSNILIRRVQPLSLVISDFGQVSFSNPISFVGTFFYRAPEILNRRESEDKHHTSAVDIYSVGMLILWLLGTTVLGSAIAQEQLWNEDHYNKVVGSKIAAAVSRHPTGEIHHALIMAQTMAQWDPAKRPSAAACLQLRWLKPARRANLSGMKSKRSSQPTQQGSQIGQPSPRRSSRIAQKSRSATQSSNPFNNAGFDEKNHDMMDID
ncbi:MAG: hypothetical protein Q9164_006174 [Protoblastenia rupestris]